MFIPGIYTGGEGEFPPPQKTYNFPHMAAKLCALDLFLASTVNYKCAVETFFWWTRNTRKLFVIKQSKWCKFMPKMQQNTFGGRALQGPAGELMRSPDPVTAMGAYL